MSPAPIPSPSDPPDGPSDGAPRRLVHGARLVVAIGADDVGSRVSVRHLIAGSRPDESGAQMTDVVGHLESWSGGLALVRRRDGEVVTVPIDRIVAAKVVPPAPPRRTR